MCIAFLQFCDIVQIKSLITQKKERVLFMIKISPVLDESSDSYQIFLADLRGKLHAALRTGRTYEQIADGLYVSPRTI